MAGCAGVTQQLSPRVAGAGCPPLLQPCYAAAGLLLPQGYDAPLYGIQAAQMASHASPSYAQQAWPAQGYAPQQAYAQASGPHGASPSAPGTDVDMCSSTELAMSHVEDQLSVLQPGQKSAQPESVCFVASWQRSSLATSGRPAGL